MAYWHHPRFSSGPHGSSTELRDFWRVLHEIKADVVVNGHDHVYERFALQDPDGNPDPISGIREFVVGTGGNGRYSFEKPVNPTSEIRNNDTYGLLKLTLHPASYDWEFVPAAGGTFTDSGSEPCR